MFNIAIYQPLIPQNAGSAMRIAAASGTMLHFIEPLGFQLSDKKLIRSAMDYRHRAHFLVHKNWEEFNTNIQNNNPDGNIYAISTKGKKIYGDVNFKEGDTFLFGSESKGLPKPILEKFPTQRILRIPMHEDERCLNLSISIAIILYEALRQTEFFKLQ